MQVQDIPRMLFDEFHSSTPQEVDKRLVASISLSEYPDAEIVFGEQVEGPYIWIFLRGFVKQYLEEGRSPRLKIAMSNSCLWVEGPIFDLQEQGIFAPLLARAQALNSEARALERAGV